MQQILLSGLVLFFTFTLEAVTGFGCTVMALPFFTMLLGLKKGVVVLTILALVLALYVALKNRKSINLRQFFIIVLMMLPGLLVGRFLQNSIDAVMLKRILAIFIILVSGLRLVFYLLKKEDSLNKSVKWYSYVALLAAGVIHGMFSSGGPLAIIYTTSAIKDKNQFRATLCLLWTSLNIILCLTYFFDSTFNADIGRTLLYLIPFMIAGMVTGDFIHSRVNDRIFTLLVYATLFITGVFMLV